MASVKVAVRVRPLNEREINMNSKCIIEMEGKRTSILNLKMASYSSTDSDELGRERVKDFFFDHSYWSFDHRSINFSSQEQVYTDLGTEVVQAADEGYNACIFAYGQTGSGKTHTMMGRPDNEGLIPRICKNLFTQIHSKESEGISFRAEVSYLEIYNERVRDLLRSPTTTTSKKETGTHTLKVREHPKDGPYVQGLTKHLVSDYAAIEAIMKQGNDLRTTASTNMNDTSSRSHAIFTVSYTQEKGTSQDVDVKNQAKFMHNLPSETTSKINLVDLAGSERADSTGATGIRLKEGANINKSLVTLGSVISSLAEASTNAKKKHLFIPYRDSVLTWLLKDSLGGNSKTIMIATISPANVNYAETLSTLRYANRAKNIINKPTVNEDANVKLICDLRAEIDALKAIIKQDGLSDAEQAAARKLMKNEERLGVLTDKWKDRWKETQKIMQERELAFQHRRDAGIRMESELPHLIAMETDLLSTGILLYHLKEGKTFVGTENSKTKPDIVISGQDILDEHCVIENNHGFVVLEPFPDASISVNGTAIRKRVKLQQGDVVILGKTTIFRFNHPKEAEELREKRKSVGPGFGNLALSAKFHSETDLLQNVRSTETRYKREQDLSRQLEEARLLLEKQKQEEERRMEETRNEFARQIREESRRLQETRGELESQKRSRMLQAQTPQEIRSHIRELENIHKESEDRRLQREKELVDSIQSKENDIEVQKDKLTNFQQECDQMKEESERGMENEVNLFMKTRGEETNQLNDEIHKTVAAEREKEENPAEFERIREIWLTETNKLTTQEDLCASLSKDSQACLADLESNETFSTGEKENLEKRKDVLKRSLSTAQTRLEELSHAKEKALKMYDQDFKIRYEIINWERQLSSQKRDKLKDDLNKCKTIHENELYESQSLLDEVKANYFNSVTNENEQLAKERENIAKRKQDIMQKSITDQREFNEKVQQYRALLQKSQSKINKKKTEAETMRTELTTMMKSKNENAKLKVDTLHIELNDIIEDIHELEKNHDVIKNEEEKVIETMMSELNAKKLTNEQETTECDKSLIEVEKITREKILLLQEEVDACEKKMLQCKSDIERDEEKLKETDVSFENETAKLDTELVYVAYLIEKEFQNKPNGPDLTDLHTSKVKLEDVNNTYKRNVEQAQKKAESELKPLIENREKAQVVLEDLIRTRGIAEVTLTELKEQFETERKQELDEIEQLRERLADWEEERDLSRCLSDNEICALQTNHFEEGGEAYQEIIQKERKKIQDEMYEKILVMEESMQKEILDLKTREKDLKALLEREQVACYENKEQLKKVKRYKMIRWKKNKVSKMERFQELEIALREKDEQLEATKETSLKEIEELRTKLNYANREIYALQEKLEKYVSLTSLTFSNRESDDGGEPSDPEMHQLLIQVNRTNELDDDELSNEDDELPKLRISPPPTPIGRFLQSVNLYKRNHIKVSIPKFILRGIGRNSYHVFEVKMTLADEYWSVYRRYRRFRDLHRDILQDYPVVASLEFPSRRYFGNRAERFVRIRRAQLEAYLTAFLAIMSNISTCRIYAASERQISKQDVGAFHPFFKQGVYEYTKNESDADLFKDD